MKTIALLLCLLAPVCSGAAQGKPNIVYIMSDELAYFELGCYGSELLKTPNMDRMAAEGIRFTDALAAAPVCAPLRAALMTGKHMGHCSVRANDGGTPLRAGEATIASMLKDRGYATGGYGKWGAGGRGSTGVPEQHGFDDFFGYYDQVHAHSFYPPYLVRNSKEVVLPGNVGGRSGKTYSHYEIMNAGLKFIRDKKDQPFFAYFPITPPHGMYDIPADDPAWVHYRDKDWPQEAKNYAAMVTMVDNDLGAILKLLKELDLEDDTMVFFAGDNGGQDRFRTGDRPHGFFGPNLNPKTGKRFRGGKGNLYEGGLRIPSLARWPGKIPAGVVSDLTWYQVDLLPTLAELTGAVAPPDIDGLSILPTLLGVGEQQKHEMLYWEFGGQFAVRFGSWKAIYPRKDKGWELYDLSKDISEEHNVAAGNPEVLKRMQAFAKAAHTPWKAGTYSDRKNHEKDRWAKWGTSKGRPQKKWPGPVNAMPRGLVSPRSWKLVSVSSENKSNGKTAAKAFDGDPRTHWHSQWSDGPTGKHPHELVIDMGDEYRVSGLVILQRQDNGWNGAVKDCELFVGNDPASFGEAALKTVLKKVKTPQSMACEKVSGRYIKLRLLTGFDDKPFGSLAEIGIMKARK